MNRIASTVAVTALTFAVGCIQKAEPHPVRNALPTAENVKINVPDQSASAQAYAVGDLADYYVLTRNLSRGLNAGAGWVLALVHIIVQFPPTTVEDNTYTWGPHSDALDPAEWKLIVTELTDGSYDWRFEGRNKIDPSAGWLTTVSGNAVPGATANRGTGHFTLDFDAAEKVNPLENDGEGIVEIVYDLENTDGTPATLSIAVDSEEPDETGTLRPVHFEYNYAENQDGSGDLQFNFSSDIDENGSAIEDAVIRSRWMSTGAGRADIRISNGDLGAGQTVEVSECWSTSFLRVYYTDSMEWAPTEGDVADCAFADQDLPDA